MLHESCATAHALPSPSSHRPLTAPTASSPRPKAGPKALVYRRGGASKCGATREPAVPLVCACGGSGRVAEAEGVCFLRSPRGVALLHSRRRRRTRAAPSRGAARAMFNSVLAQHAQRQLAQREENGARAPLRWLRDSRGRCVRATPRAHAQRFALRLRRRARAASGCCCAGDGARRPRERCERRCAGERQP